MHGFDRINRALVVLLPKKEGTVESSDYRPVSLIHGSVRIFGKALANRLASELSSLFGTH